MNARDDEAALLARCAAVSRDPVQTAKDQREANVFRLAAMVVRSSFPDESKRLMSASDQYFSRRPDEILDPADIVRKGWVVSLPRLRDMLGRLLHEH